MVWGDLGLVDNKQVTMAMYKDLLVADNGSAMVVVVVCVGQVIRQNLVMFYLWWFLKSPKSSKS